MRKILCFIAIILSGIMLVGCGNVKQDKVNLVSHFIEIRKNLFVGEDANYYVTLCTGQREQDYALDGTVNKLIPFGIVTIARFDNKILNQDSYQFTLVVNGENLTGLLEKSPYDNTYSADIEQAIADDAQIMLQLVIDGANFSKELTNISSTFSINKDNLVSI